MFNNCRQYNEEGSVIYEDANTLERVLLDKAREIGLSSALANKHKKSVLIFINSDIVPIISNSFMFPEKTAALHCSQS